LRFGRQLRLSAGRRIGYHALCVWSKGGSCGAERAVVHGKRGAGLVAVLTVLVTTVWSSATSLSVTHGEEDVPPVVDFRWRS
jgi:hypothetical protein